MNSDGNFTIAVVSDLHAFEQEKFDPAPSHLDMSVSRRDSGKNPVTALKKLIVDEGLTANLLLCPGDLAHQAHPEALRFAWEMLNSLVSDLGNPALATASGNHDVDSRYVYNKFDAKGFLQELEPAYPLLDESLCDQYWARNFAVLKGDQYRVVVLNSSAYHGGSPEKEYLHGRVADSTLRRIQSELEGTAAPLINILLCHHHPQQHHELDDNEYDVMSGGQLLLDMLGSGSFGRWLVIHGHKHHPKLTYAQGSSASPVVLSAGSLCAALFPALQTNARNQFHFIEVPIADSKDRGLVGVIRSWDWAVGKGWLVSREGSGLPGVCGFGNREDSAALASAIKEKHDEGLKSWQAILTALPRLRYLLPIDVEILKRELKARHCLQLTESDGVITEVGECF